LDLDWASPAEIDFLKNSYLRKDNILVIGSTGVGKTTVIDSLIQLTDENQRVLILEDTDEITKPNDLSVKMLTRFDPQGIFKEITLTDLIRQSLRLRPDRIIVGEVRSAEAKDLLLALSTGHAGSLCTLHASNAQQAMIRLEMLVQMGAPQWSLETIRKLIFMSLKLIVTVGRDENGKRKLMGLHQLSSHESMGIILEQLQL
jgi:pilus assembly protein CpaF